MPALTPGMATADPPGPQPEPAHRPMRLDGLDGIGRTGRREPALLAHPGAEKIPVEPDRGDQQRAHHDAIRVSKASASARTWRFRAVRLAAGGRLTRRNTRTPSGSPARRKRKASRRTRLMALRVTARGAWRLGTISPSRAGPWASPRGLETTNKAPR